MAEMTNSLKEVDMKIVMKRLEARKRDVNKDGSLSKKQLAAAYRGYHGLEMQYHALTRMSNDRLAGVKAANDNIAVKYDAKIRHMLSQEKVKEDIIERDLKTMRQDFTSQLAYQYVYKNYSLRQTEKDRKKPRPFSDRPDMYESEKRQSANPTTPRPLGSLRQIETYQDELKLKFPPIKDKKKTCKSSVESPRMNTLGDRSYADLRKLSMMETKKDVPLKDSFPNIEEALEIRYRHRISDDDKGSLLSAPAGLIKESDKEGADVHIEIYSMGQNLMLMRKLAQEKYDRSRMLPAPPPSRSETRKESWRRILPPTPDRPPSSVFPNNTKNSSDVKKLIRKEAASVMETWAQTNKRKEAVEKMKEVEKAKKLDSTFPTIAASRPTSAILKEFIEYKKAQEEEKQLREERLADQPLFVRQMSPQQRPTSAHLLRREYSAHINSRPTSREGSVVLKESPVVRRTDSEKIPSVSRTASLNILSIEPVELHENALLTAAERIEMERERIELEKDIDAYNRAIEESSKQPRRRLPQTPNESNPKPSRKRPREKKKQRQQPKMFDTSVLAINRVSQANKSHWNHTNVTRTTNKSAHSEIDSVNDDTNYSDHSQRPSSLTQLERRLMAKINSSNTDLDHYDHKLDADKLEFITTATGKKLFPKKVQRDYDNCSRTTPTPDMRRHLELRAKIKKKVKQKNAQLADERKAHKKKDDGSSVVDSERAGTQVSFNENVVVFQTI